MGAMQNRNEHPSRPRSARTARVEAQRRKNDPAPGVGPLGREDSNPPPFATRRAHSHTVAELLGLQGCSQ